MNILARIKPRSGVNPKQSVLNKTQLNPRSGLNSVVSRENHERAVVHTISFAFPVLIDPPFVFNMDWHSGSISFIIIHKCLQSLRSHRSELQVKGHFLALLPKEFLFAVSVPLDFCLFSSVLRLFNGVSLGKLSPSPALPGVPLRHRCFERAPRRTYFCALVRSENLVN